jgi:hypothetical protein
MMFLEANSKGDRQVFMVVQGDAPVDQTEEEIARAVEAEITRLERLARNIDNATGKRDTLPRDRHGDVADSDDGRDGVASSDTTLNLIDIVVAPLASL